MSKPNGKKYFNQKTIKRRKEMKIGKIRQTHGTSLSKREASINWMNFMGSNGFVSKMKHSVYDDGKNSNITKKKPENTKVVALDCEMVSNLNNEDMLARVSLVNYKLDCIYDKYVKPTARVGDFRTRFSGIREEDLLNGSDFETVRSDVKNLLHNKILVGHALGNDFRVLKFGHNKKLIRDTSKYEYFKNVSNSKSPSLKKLAKIFLNENIQNGEHNSIEDASTTMKLYKKYKKEWETSLLNSKFARKQRNSIMDR